MNLQSTEVQESGHASRSFSRLHFIANLGINSVLVPLFWIAALIAFIKSFYVENTFGLVLALLLAAMNTCIAFYRRQDFIRSATIYLGSIIFLIHDQRPDNVVAFCFLAVALAFLVNDRKMMQRIPYYALILILGYAATLMGVAFWSSEEIDVSVLYPELGCFIVIVLIFKDLFLPRPAPKSQSLPVLRLADFSLTARELAIVRLMNDRLTAKEIASQLGVNAGTVRMYQSQVYEKVGVPGRSELVLMLHTHQVHFGETGETGETKPERPKKVKS